MKQILRNEYLIGYSALYLVTLILMVLIEHFPVSQSVAMLLIVGIFFTLVAYLTSKSSIPLFADKATQKNEGLVLALILVFIILILTLGDNQIKSIFSFRLSESPIATELFTLFYRLLIFVLIPFLVYKFIYKFSLHDFGLVVKAKEFFTIKNFLIFLAMAIVILLFQFFLGNGASSIRAGLISGRQLYIGLPLLYLFLIIRVGLVEEFFFRGLVQSRLAAITKSEIGGIILSDLFFGLAHAPGFYLRGGGTLDNLGQHPSFFMSVGYSILILSVGGFFLSVIWSKTRNLWLVMAIHACVDLLPGLQEFVKTWGIN
jgi:membrane protease YdiL (CAAX protease family)